MAGNSSRHHAWVMSLRPRASKQTHKPLQQGAGNARERCCKMPVGSLQKLQIDCQRLGLICQALSDDKRKVYHHPEGADFNTDDALYPTWLLPLAMTCAFGEVIGSCHAMLSAAKQR